MSNANRDRRGSVRAGLSQVHSTLNDGIYDGALPELNYADREELNDEHYGGAPSIPLEDEESIRTSNEDYSEEAKDPQAYAPGPEGDEKGKPTQNNNPEPTNTLTKTKTRFFSPNFKDQRKRVAYRWLLAVFSSMCFCFTILVSMWGVLYRTPHYVRRAKVLAVIQEDQVYRFNDTVQFPSVSSPLYDIIAEVPLSWEIYNATSFQIKYNVEGIEAMNQKVIDLVYKEEFWLALNVQGNVTDTLVRSLISADSDVQFNSTSLFEVVYESGRDITNLPSVLSPVFQGIEGVFQKVYTYQYLPQSLGNITNGDNFNPARVAAAGRMKFNYNDYRPVTDRVTLLSTQIGAVYCLSLTVFQFLVFGPSHGEMSRMIKFSNLWIYRSIVLWSVLFFVSIFWCTVSAMYQVDFTKAFGRAGFVVYWMSTYSYMLAVGGSNENVIMLIISISPSYIGFWILSFVISNSAPAFFAIGYANVFYRYGYAMPSHCIVGINRVIFFDISKHQLGRNYGISCAWVGLNTISMPFVSKFVSKTSHKRARKAAMEKSG